MSNRFEIGDRVQVTKSITPDYIGIEGVITSVYPDNDSIFTSYAIRTDDGELFEFLEYQLERNDE